MIVVDASTIVDVLLGNPGLAALGQRLFTPGECLNAPHLIDLEVAQTLRRAVSAGVLDGERAEQALQDLADLPLVRHPHVLFLPRIWQLRLNLTAYDAAYLALAEALDAPLLTRDRRLAAAPGHRAEIEVV